MKKFLLLILCLVSSLMASAESGTCGDNLTWTLEEGILVISGTGAMTNYSVFSNAPWYSSRSTISLAIISEGVTSIGNSAFSHCSGLTFVTIPNSVTSIGRSAFQSCSGLTSVTIPNSVTSIGSDAFWGCSSLTSVTIPNSVTSIGGNAFCGCSGLTSITIPNSVTSIGEFAFWGCSGLTSVTIPNSVTRIEGDVFRDCSSLISITIPNSVTSIGDGAFSGCRTLSHVNISCKDIDDFCRYLERSDIFSIFHTSTLGGKEHGIYIAGELQSSIIIPSSVTNIGDYAFFGCNNLKQIENQAIIPQSITSTTFSSYNADLIVSGSSFQSYRTAPYWQNFTIKVNGSCAYDVLDKNSKTAIVLQCYERNAVIPVKVNIDGQSYTVTKLGSDLCTEKVLSLTIPESVIEIDGSQTNIPAKIIWQTNTPPAGYEKLNAANNYVSNNEYTALSNTKVYPYLSSMFEVDGVKYVPVNPAARTCAAIDCTYDPSIESINIGEKVSYRGIELSIGKIEPYSFYKNTYLKSVQWNNTTAIEDHTFDGCSSIQGLVIGNSVVSIGSYAFNGCSSIPELIIPNSVTTIGDSAFNGCSSIPELIIPNSVTTIGNSAFKGCILIPELAIPNSVTMIGNYAFAGCTKISNLLIEDRTTPLQLGSNGSNGLFFDCPLSTLYLGGKITYNTSSSSGYSPFYQQSSLTSLTIKGEDTLYDREFFGCSSLPELTIPNSVTAIGNYAFAGCTKINNLLIEDRTTPLQLGSNGSKGLFSDCPLSTLYLGGKIAYNTSSGYSPFYQQSSLTSLTIKGEDTLYYREFYGCSSIKELTINNSVTTIGNYAFFDCSSIPELIIPNSVTSIGDYAFKGCSSIAELIIPNSVTTIGNYAFSECTQLAKIHIADRATSLRLGSNGSKGLFSDCPLDEVYVGGKITYDTSSGKGFSPFYKKMSLTSLTIKGEQDLYDKEFYGCTKLSQVSIAEGIKSIGCSTFQNCTSIIELKIPSSISTIGDYAFSGCSSMPELIVPASVSSIGDYVFAGCTQLADIHFADRTEPLRLGSNGSSALFSDCPLDEVYVGGKITYDTSSEKGYSPFYRNKTLRTIKITDRETEIYDNEFYGCTNLTDVIIGDDVSRIGNWAFSGCSSLENFAFGESVSSIGQEAFSDCTALTKIVSLAQVPPTCGSQALEDINKWTCTLCVYEDNIADYQIADQWKDFFFIKNNIDEIPVKIVSVTVLSNDEQMGTVTGSGEYNRGQNVTLTAIANEGYKFVRWSDDSTTNPYVFTASRNGTLTAIFKEIVPTYTITVTSENEAMGSVEGGGVYDQGTEVTVRATAATGFEFVRWNDGSTQNPYVLNATEDKELIAYFQPAIVRTVQSVTQASTFSPNKWYMITQSRSGESAAYENMETSEICRAASGTKVMVGDNYENIKNYLVRFVPTTISNIYHIQMATGNYWPTTNRTDYNSSGIQIYTTSDIATAGNYFVYNIQNAQSHFAINLTTNNSTYGLILDNNGAGSNASFWGTGKVNSLNGNNDWKFYEVELPVVIRTACNPEEGNVSGMGAYRIGTQVSLNATPNDGYSFVRWSDGSTQNPYVFTATTDKSIVAEFQSNNIQLTDGTPFCQSTDMRCSTLTYTRTFSEKNAGHWQAWYVPFDLNPAEYADDFTFARIYMMAYVNPNTHTLVSDPTQGELSVVLKYLEDGELVQAGTPYVIKANQTGEQTFESVDGVLHAATENHTIASSTTSEVFTFSGNYESVTCPAGWYAIAASGGFIAAEGKTLSPYRWHFEVTPTGYGSSVQPAAVANARMYVMDEDNRLLTSVMNMQAQADSYRTYDMQGRLLKGRGAQHGISIRNGRKYVR